jgi:hypothetical protein
MLPQLKVEPETGCVGELTQMLAAIESLHTLGQDLTGNSAV